VSETALGFDNDAMKM